MLKPIAKRLHDPQAKLDYTVDWSLWLATGETISAVDWSASPAGLTLPDSSIADDGLAATIWVQGGPVGAVYTITCHITTSSGREDDRSFVLSIEQR